MVQLNADAVEISQGDDKANVDEGEIEEATVEDIDENQNVGEDLLHVRELHLIRLSQH